MQELLGLGNESSRSIINIFWIQALQYRKPYPKNQLDTRPITPKQKKHWVFFLQNYLILNDLLVINMEWLILTLVISPVRMEITPTTAQTTRKTIKMIKHTMSVYLCRFKFPSQFTTGASCWGTDSTFSFAPQQPIIFQLDF